MPDTGVEPPIDEGWDASSEIASVARSVGRRYGLDPAEIADLAQEIRIAHWRRRAETPVRWLLVVASRRAVDLIRSRVRIRARERAFAGLGPASQESPELTLLVRARASSLGSPLRELYALRYRLGFSQDETGRALGLSRAEIRTLEIRLIRGVTELAPPPRSRGERAHRP